MERIMPIDLENAKLKKSFRGYETTAVENLLQSSARSMETLISENAALRDQVDRLRAELDGYKSQENTLRDAIVLAQRAADDTRSTAQRHAEVILEEARQSALAERVNAQQKVSELRWDIERLKQDRQRFVEDFRALLERYQRDNALSNGFCVVQGVEEESIEATAVG